MKIALIPNPSARAFREDRKLMEQLWRLVQGRGIVTEPTSVDDLPDAIADAREFGVDTLVIAGGDGTTGRVTSALLADWPHDKLPKLYVLHAEREPASGAWLELSEGGALQVELRSGAVRER